MKSSDFLQEGVVRTTIESEIDDDMRDPKRRQARLKAEVEAGYMPTVHNVSSTTEPVYTMGDLEALGWMTKDYHSVKMGHDDYDVTWTRYYHKEAPGSIRVKSGSHEEVWSPGHQEEE